MTRLPLRDRLGWAVGDYGLNIYWQALNLLMLPFYTDVLGLDPRLAGLVFLLASLWDGVADSAIGALADRTRSRHGSYRPYLLFGGPLVAACFMLAFVAPDWEMKWLFAYALGSQILVRTAYSIVQIPYSSLSARITGNADERASLAGYRMAFAMLGGITVTALMPTAVDLLQDRLGETAWSYAAAAGLAGMLSIPVFLLCFASTREPPALRNANPSGLGWGAVVEDLVTVVLIARLNGPLMRLLACMVVSSLAFTMTNKCLTYYINHYLERPDLRQYILPFALLANLVCCPVWAWIAQRTSKRNAWLGASVVSTFAYLFFYLLPTRDPVVAALQLGLVSVGNAAYITLVWAMLPDTVEYNQWKTGQRHDAKVFGVASFAKQLALGLNGLALGFLLSAVGYVEKSATQSPAAIEGVRAIMTLVPLGGIVLAAWLIWGYRLDRREHARIAEEAAAAAHRR